MASKSVSVAQTSAGAASISTDVSTVAWVALSCAMLPCIKVASHAASADNGEEIAAATTANAVRLFGLGEK